MSRKKSSPQELSLVADRAHRLFLYLRDLVRVRSKSVRDIDVYERVLWLKDIPSGELGWSIFTDSDQTTDSEAWFEVRRIQLPKAPDPPDIIYNWVNIKSLDRASLEEPGLIKPDDPEQEIPEQIYQAYQKYLDDLWLPWQKEHLSIKPYFDFYTDLFEMGKRRQTLGEIFEIVVGFGFLTWVRDDILIRRHMITAPAELIVDGATGNIEVRPSNTEGRNRFELDMLDPPDQGSPTTIRELGEIIENNDPLQLNKTAISVCDRWINYTHSKGIFNPTMVPQSPTETISVTLSPALILRRRDQRYLADLLDNIAGQIKSKDEIPEGIHRIVSYESARVAEEKTGQGEPTLVDPEIYFPLPSNEEQRKILDSLQQPCVVVQGPPGTGKSHTIANLLSHLLAQGKRVLVTSHTERALRVLRDKLPETIQPLCISLLGNDRQSIRDLESAVGIISNRRFEWISLLSNNRIDELKNSLVQIRSQYTKNRNKLFNIREQDIDRISLGNYNGTIQKIAKKLYAEENRLSWIPDANLSEKPSISNEEFRLFLDLYWELPDDPDTRAIADLRLPLPSDILSAEEIRKLFDLETDYSRKWTESVSRFGQWINELDNMSEEIISKIITDVEIYKQAIEPLKQKANLARWLSDAVPETIHGLGKVWKVRYDELKLYHGNLESALEKLGKSKVSIYGDITPSLLETGTNDLISYLLSGRRIRLGLLSRGAARRNKQLLESVQVDGEVPDSISKLQLLQNYLTAEINLQKIEHIWSNWFSPLKDSDFERRKAYYDDYLYLLEEVLNLPILLQKWKSPLFKIDGIPTPNNWDDISHLKDIIDALEAVVESRGSIEVCDRISNYSRLLKRFLKNDTNNNSILESLIDAIINRDLKSYTMGLESLNNMRVFIEKIRLKQCLLSKMDQLPILLGFLSTKQDQIWIDRANELDQAWNWRYANTKLKKILNSKPHLLKRKMEVLQRQELDTLLDLATELAWTKMFENLSVEQEVALRAWAKAIKKIGRGTGKYAEQHRRTARKYMKIAQTSIPAWIMPTYRVAESVEANPGSFDVIIVDEASQSGVESLFLFYLGKRLVIVGDDQQIAPDAVGINQTEVMRLQDQYLGDMPFNELFDSTSSLFDQADIRFGNRIVLREHFRCMPEIIEFSNKIAYPQTKLWPLRQYGIERLEPIKTVYLKHGYRENQSQAINKPEAEEIVARIQQICSDNKYDGKTIGVISLQGKPQAQYIGRLLIERLGPQTLEERLLTCGDSYAFQGDERHIIFLSMVSATNRRIGSLSTQQAKRRFNVAGSRAQDQVWLVHSVLPADLGLSDMRREMLEYYLEPTIEHWEELLNLDTSVLNEPFESQFEQDVYIRLRERGFRVEPQFRVGQYRIDLVIHGSSTKLAVECDGDQWHGPEQWDHDMIRQRRLERSGWEFIRIRGSHYYRDPDSALQQVWKKCKDIGITSWNLSQENTQISESPITGPGTSSDGYSTTGNVYYSRGVEIMVHNQGKETKKENATGDPYSHNSGKEASLHMIPYKVWEGDQLQHPDTVNITEIANNLLSIIETEGPVTLDRVYRVYIKGAGSKRVTRNVKDKLDTALNTLKDREEIICSHFSISSRKDHFSVSRWEDQIVVRTNNTPPIILREKGERDLYDIPIDEIRGLISIKYNENSSIDSESLMRFILDVHNLKRLTDKTRTYLLGAIDLHNKLD